MKVKRIRMKRPGVLAAEMKSVPDPGPPTLRECVENMPANIIEAARLEAAAIAAFKNLPPGHDDEEDARYFVRMARAEKAHWREYLTAVRLTLETHPELADQPIGTRCRHGCTIGNPLPSLLLVPTPDREIGADDGEIPQDRRLPPERELPF